MVASTDPAWSEVSLGVPQQWAKIQTLKTANVCLNSRQTQDISSSIIKNGLLTAWKCVPFKHPGLLHGILFRYCRQPLMNFGILSDEWREAS
jgi:hypothetical protein